MNPNSDIQKLEARVRKLAEEKSYLQLVIRMIEQLNPLPGLRDMVGSMLTSIVETIGGTNIRAGVVELKRQCGIGGGTDNMFRLLNIRQWMRVSARRGKTGGASGCCYSGIVCLTCSGKRRQGKGT